MARRISTLDEIKAQQDLVDAMYPWQRELIYEYGFNDDTLMLTRIHNTPVKARAALEAVRGKPLVLHPRKRTM